MAGIESTLATPMEEMLQNLQFHNDAVMQIKSNIQNREMKLEETKQGQEMRHQASSHLFLFMFYLGNR